MPALMASIAASGAVNAPAVRTQLIEQRLERLELTDRRELAPVARDGQARLLPTTRTQRVPHGELQQTLVRVPVRGASVEFGDEVG